jgi:hypothetical protein
MDPLMIMAATLLKQRHAGQPAEPTCCTDDTSPPRARAKSPDTRLTCADAPVESRDPGPNLGRRVDRPTAGSF